MRLMLFFNLALVFPRLGILGLGPLAPSTVNDGWVESAAARTSVAHDGFPDGHGFTDATRRLREGRNDRP